MLLPWRQTFSPTPLKEIGGNENGNGGGDLELRDKRK
jgi:hypothetical protein